jgi:hypothetical protein
VFPFSFGAPVAPATIDMMTFVTLNILALEYMQRFLDALFPISVFENKLIGAFIFDTDRGNPLR